MNTSSTISEAAPLSLAAGAASAHKAAALAVLEQMYGYFSYEPLPLERDRVRLAA